ncbi:MAG: hypothetical protein AB4080_07440 [Trichodesmium sp.]
MRTSVKKIKERTQNAVEDSIEFAQDVDEVGFKQATIEKGQDLAEEAVETAITSALGSSVLGIGMIEIMKLQRPDAPIIRQMTDEQKIAFDQEIAERREEEAQKYKELLEIGDIDLENIIEDELTEIDDLLKELNDDIDEIIEDLEEEIPEGEELETDEYDDEPLEDENNPLKPKKCRSISFKSGDEVITINTCDTAENKKPGQGGDSKYDPPGGIPEPPPPKPGAWVCPVYRKVYITNDNEDTISVSLAGEWEVNHKWARENSLMQRVGYYSIEGGQASVSWSGKDWAPVPEGEQSGSWGLFGKPQCNVVPFCGDAIFLSNGGWDSFYRMKVVYSYTYWDSGCHSLSLDEGPPPGLNQPKLRKPPDQFRKKPKKKMNDDCCKATLSLLRKISNVTGTRDESLYPSASLANGALLRHIVDVIQNVAPPEESGLVRKIALNLGVPVDNFNVNELTTDLLKLIPRKNGARSHARAAVNYLTIPINGKRNLREASYHFNQVIKALKN